MLFTVFVETRLRPGIADPQGGTIERSLPHLGFEGISGMRVGKAFRFSLEAADEATAQVQADEVTQRLLINPVIEDADVSVSVVEPA
jgi:phosphoribosylformylglycinamidine synthase PurS subunit